MSNMVVKSLRIYQNVVKKNYNKLVKNMVKDRIHSGYESSGCICQTKRHYQEFKMPIPGSEGYFWDITISDSNLMVIASKINFVEVLCSLKPIKEFFNTLQRVAILDSDFVQGPIVDAHAQGSLLDK